MEKISPPVRILALALVLAGLGGVLAMRMLGPSDEPVAIPLPAKKPAAAKSKELTPATPKPATTPAPAAEEPPAVNSVKQKLPPTGFPKVVDRALRDHEVVVLSLVVPGARVDELAAAEAEAGAKLGGAGFLALNVLDESVARALLAKLEGVQDPSVVVVKRPGDVALQLNGFVDRETVAQAAANASS